MEDILVDNFLYKRKKKLPWMKAVLDNFLATFAPFVINIKYINITPFLKAESWFS